MDDSVVRGAINHREGLTRSQSTNSCFCGQGYRSALADPGRLGEPTLLESAGCAGRVVSSKRPRFEYRKNGTNVAFFVNGTTAAAAAAPWPTGPTDPDLPAARIRCQ